MAASAVPITGLRFGIEADGDAVHLADATHDIPAHPKMISRVCALARANLVLPLTRHHFSIDTRDCNTSIAACLVMRLHDLAAKAHIDASPTVVRSLRLRWNTAFR